jgi:hypothetical protein
MKVLTRDFSIRHPGEAGVHPRIAGLDSGFRRNDETANPEAGFSGKNCIESRLDLKAISPFC